MAPRTREELVREGFAAFIDNDAERLFAFLDPQIEVFTPVELMNAGRYHGHQGFVEWASNWTGAWESLRYDLGGATEVGERCVILEVTQNAKGRDGIELQMDVAFLFEIQGELCTYLALLMTPEDAEEIAIEREQDGPGPASL